ncbi:hypothetical protein MLD38_019541 [Melastoma candidum]|uniref:Uncharacterized protein n=1 Tax=Melastoma candidum TaxID=119954 RepID=A0ACB9R0D5_9MYRT|nr:hypothetical protein MLD38_019541 [Melastoma candidum]
MSAGTTGSHRRGRWSVVARERQIGEIPIAETLLSWPECHGREQGSTTGDGMRPLGERQPLGREGGASRDLVRIVIVFSWPSLLLGTSGKSSLLVCRQAKGAGMARGGYRGTSAVGNSEGRRERDDYFVNPLCSFPREEELRKISLPPEFVNPQRIGGRRLMQVAPRVFLSCGP